MDGDERVPRVEHQNEEVLPRVVWDDPEREARGLLRRVNYLRLRGAPHNAERDGRDVVEPRPRRWSWLSVHTERRRSSRCVKGKWSHEVRGAKVT